MVVLRGLLLPTLFYKYFIGFFCLDDGLCKKNFCSARIHCTQHFDVVLRCKVK